MSVSLRGDALAELHTLQEELKRLGISVVSGRQNTVISVKIKGLAGRALLRGLRLADQLLQEKIKQAIKSCTDPTTKLFTDPTFGPSGTDPDGAAAICKAGAAIPSKGGSQHQAKVLGLLQRGKLRWERPLYATEAEMEGDSSQEGDEDPDDVYSMSSSQDSVFATKATLFADGVSSGDVIQGNLGDCWFLSALSVVATRSDLLEQTFWRGDQHKTKGLFVCKFMKNFVWNYVLIDDRLPVFGFTDKKPGKPYFARCRNPDELWVSLIEKAYAKLHGSYESLIGGFVDCALNDITGMCSEQIILKAGFPGFGENPYTPAKPQQNIGDPFWEKIIRYKDTGTLMGCSIQPPVTASKDVAAESSAGNGLYYKHAYALVDAAEIKTRRGDTVRLVKLRNPWGMGEWTGPWSDSSEERAGNEDAIEKFFKIMKRRVGANADKRVFMALNAKGQVTAEEISQEDVVEINANDGTFFMSFDAWMQSFTHFFAGIDFPDSWHGRRSEGSWNETNNGGNTTKTTWINNPHFELILEQRAQIFVSLSQEDPRGTDSLKIVPVGFHICSLSAADNDSNKYELREPKNKPGAYYRLYKPADRENFQTGKRPEHLPPAIIPGSVIPGVDDDGVPQPAYTFKQAVSIEATVEPGRYCIIPSMYMRTDKATGNTNVGSFWISVYSDKPTFRLEGGEKIVEEEEGDEEPQTNEVTGGRSSISRNPSADKRLATNSTGTKSGTSLTVSSSISAEKRRMYEKDKEELLRQAKRYGIGLREIRTEFAKVPKIQKAECRQRLHKLGFRLDNWDDDKLGFVFGGLEEASSGAVIFTDKVLKLFTPDTHEEKLACELPDLEEDDDATGDIHREGILEVELHGANGLAVQADTRRPSTQRKVQVQGSEFSVSQNSLRRKIAFDILERDISIASQLRHFAKYSALLSKSQFALQVKKRDGANRSIRPYEAPVERFYTLLEEEYVARLQACDIIDDTQDITPISRTPVYSKRDGTPSYLSPLSPKGLTANIEASDAVGLHKSDRIRDLETKRSQKLVLLLQHKQQALGNAEKTASLPRLIGGRKSGSSNVSCVDCGIRVRIAGRGNQMPNDISSCPCKGSSCVNVFCSYCYDLLPAQSKLCEECFQHEPSPDEKIGEQLRVVLIEKIGATNQQRSHLEDVFRSFDADGSGALSPQEFEKMIQLLEIRPPLTQGQMTFLVDQFDTNGDGEISLLEFKHWILKDRVWEDNTPRTDASGYSAQTTIDTFDRVIAPVCEDILSLAFDAYSFSSTIDSWSHAKKTKKNENQTREAGVVIFKRVLSLPIDAGVVSHASEKTFRQFNDSSVQLNLGDQCFLIIVAIDKSHNLSIRVRDPILKLADDITLSENEYDYDNLVAQLGGSLFDRRLQEVRRESELTQVPQGLITADMYPELYNTLLSMISRLRIAYQQRQDSDDALSQPRRNSFSLSLVESDSFVTTLRSLFSRVDLPFFWSVSPRYLVLSIDNEYLEERNESSFQQVIAELLSPRRVLASPSLRALTTFISHTDSLLLVRYEVIGKHTNVEISWREFQDFIAGYQDTYAVVQLQPQGDTFMTRIARTTAAGAVQWNFKKQIFIKEPEVCDHRIDRPVIFTDTVKIANIPGSLPMTNNIGFITDDAGKSPGHFVVVSVRRALPSGSHAKQSRIYCTAYDPLTSCDYAVEDYPPDWSAEFFDATINPNFESQWQNLLSKMHLGAPLTPKLSITVFNKQSKTDKLLGECEVSVGSAITLEGHIFEERIALHCPDLPSAGVTCITFRFDVKKTYRLLPDAEHKVDPRHLTGTSIPVKFGAQYLAGEIESPRTEIVKDNDDDKLQQLRASMASVEQAKLDAQEQVRQLRVQVQQLASAANRASEDTVERWKRRLDQARQEQFATEEEHAKRLVALQTEISRLAEDNEKQKNAPREASNLKDCNLSAEASANDILSAMRGILLSRCPERPYNGLKKALATEADVPGKITFAVLNDVLGDFGLALSSAHQSTLSSILDPDMSGRVTIEDFFIKLCDDAESYAMIKTPRPPTPEPIPVEEPPESVVFTPSPPTTQRPVSPVASPVRAAAPKPKMAWQDMKKFLILNLPEGWETRFTEKGRPYFCNHANRSTQWKHPRPEIETIFSEWVQENGAFFNRRSTSARASKPKH